MMRMGSFDISASALTAQRLRMDVAAANIANADVSRGRLVNGQWVPYQRKMVVLESKQPSRFDQALSSALGQSPGQGVRVAGIVEDRTPFKRIYDPTHPDADADGYVQKPNVDVLKEMVDLMSASRSYEASVTALNASKAMYMKALEIGR